MPAILHDKFYTPDATARRCVGQLWQTLGLRSDDLFIEPSAGAGAFCRHLPRERLIALDIAPEAKGIATADFLGFEAPMHGGRRIVIGNPPFGRNGALARAFLRQAMGFADIVAFILPASFAKASMQRGLDRRFHLAHESRLEDQHFETCAGEHVVNTVFQVWERREILREAAPDVPDPGDFAFVRDIRDADLVIRRVGARAGAVLAVPDLTAEGGLPPGHSPNSNYYLRAVGCDPAILAQRLGALDLARLARNAVCPSLSRRDLVACYLAARVAAARLAATNARPQPRHAAGSSPAGAPTLRIAALPSVPCSLQAGTKASLADAASVRGAEERSGPMTSAASRLRVISVALRDPASAKKAGRVVTSPQPEPSPRAARPGPWPAPFRAPVPRRPWRPTRQPTDRGPPPSNAAGPPLSLGRALARA